MHFADKLRAWLPLHQHPLNRAVHLGGAFMFVFALWVPLSMTYLPAADVNVTPARVATIALMAYAIWLERTAGALYAVLLVPVLKAAESVAALPLGEAVAVCGATMALRFGVVIAGHLAFERKTHGLSLGGPLLFLTEPVYLFTQLMFGLGCKQDLLTLVQRRDPVAATK